MSDPLAQSDLPAGLVTITIQFKDETTYVVEVEEDDVKVTDGWVTIKLSDKKTLYYQRDTIKSMTIEGK